MVIAQISSAPFGKGTSVSKYVKVVKVTLRKEQDKFETNTLATIIKTQDLAPLFYVVQKAHRAALTAGIECIITESKIDEQKDKKATMKSKVNSFK